MAAAAERRVKELAAENAALVARAPNATNVAAATTPKTLKPETTSLLTELAVSPNFFNTPDALSWALRITSTSICAMLASSLHKIMSPN